MRGLCIIRGLSEKFEKAASELRQKSTLDPEEVTVHLMQEELRLQATKGEGKTSAMNAAQKKTKSKLKCWNCGKTGHVAAKCRKPPKDNGSGSNGSSTQNAIVFVAALQSNTHDGWIIDSGATDHMTDTKTDLASYEEFEHPLTVQIAEQGRTLKALGKGTVKINNLYEGKEVPCVLSDVLYVSDLGRRLLSISKIENRGLNITFDKGRVIFSKDGKKVGTGR